MIRLKTFKNTVLCATGFLLLTVVSSCSKEDTTQAKTETPANAECQVKGRWISTLYPNTLYEFTDSLRYTIYDNDGTFGSIDDAIPNPKRWWMTADTLYVDLNFGNITSGNVVFKCDCKVMEIQASGEGLAPVRFHKEGFDPKTCP